MSSKFKSSRELLTSVDSLFTTQAERDDELKPKVEQIALDLIDGFENHPFSVKDDEDMQNLVRSISENGVLVPCLARQNGERYELISGHRRKAACEALGIATLPIIIKDMTREEAIITMVDSNIQREHILPSEKGFAYKMKMDALSHQGKTSDQVGPKLTVEQISKDDSATQVKRYIRLTELIPQLLELVDLGKMGMRPAVELSYLDKDDQALVYELMLDCVCTPSHAQAIRIRRLAEKEILCEDLVEEILREEKANQKEKIHIRYDQIRDLIPRNISFEETTEYIKTALRFYQEAHAKK